MSRDRKRPRLSCFSESCKNRTLVFPDIFSASKRLHVIKVLAKVHDNIITKIIKRDLPKAWPVQF